MERQPTSEERPLGPYQPAVIIHGGAGGISRTNLPPELYGQYRKSLLDYLTKTKQALHAGKSALDAACLAVSLLEDDPLFNCGRGSVFTEAGTIEMEASVMVCSLDESMLDSTAIKRAGAVSLVKNTRHPIYLAREVLLGADDARGQGKTASMHCHLSGLEVEEWGWNEKGLERKKDEWFWTQKRWDEHWRGLHPDDSELNEDLQNGIVGSGISTLPDLPSQGTVGAVCLDSWGNLAVATSTGGLTNKKVGRIGDSPTIGAGFWAESWDEEDKIDCERDEHDFNSYSLSNNVFGMLRECLSSTQLMSNTPKLYHPISPSTPLAYAPPEKMEPIQCKTRGQRRRAVAMSGTGNGDSFLRIDAVRTSAAMCRFSPHEVPLADAVTAISGPGGELQRSAGDRWAKTGEGQGGIIGIEVVSDSRFGTPVFDFNCTGLWRAWFALDPKSGAHVPKVMVFRDEYK